MKPRSAKKETAATQRKLYGMMTAYLHLVHSGFTSGCLRVEAAEVSIPKVAVWANSELGYEDSNISQGVIIPRATFSLDLGNVLLFTRQSIHIIQKGT